MTTSRSIRWISASLISLLSLSAASVACKRTVEGVKGDTSAAVDTVNEKSALAEQELEAELGEFKTKTQAKLDELAVAVAALEAKAQDGVDRSKSQLAAQIDQTKAELSRLQADSRAELQRAKSDLDARIAGFGKRVNTTLDEVGSDLDQAGDKVEKKLE